MKRTDRIVLREDLTWLRSEPSAPRAQRGQIMVLTALMMVVIIGFAGLVIDVGHEMTKYRQARNAADAAALAAAYDLYYDSTHGISPSTDMATEKAKLLVRQNGFRIVDPSSPSLPDGDLQSVTFLDQNYVATSTLSNVRYVKAAVSNSFSTYFVRVLGINTQSVGTSAIAKVELSRPCDMCALANLNPSQPGITFGGNGAFDGQNINVGDNSTAGNALDFSGANAQFNDPGGSANVVGGCKVNTGDCAFSHVITTTLNLNAPPVSDPLAALPSLFDGNKPILYTLQSAQSIDFHSGSQTLTINPGIYSDIKDTSSMTLTMTPGIYVITGSFTDNGGPIVGKGVLLYIGCAPANSFARSAGPWVPCSDSAVNPTSGSLSLGGSGGSQLSLSAMISTQAAQLAKDPTVCDESSTSYDYGLCTSQTQGVAALGGLLIYQDRNDQLPLSITGNGDITASSVSGSIYAKSASASVTGNGAMQMAVDSLLVADTISLSGSTNSQGMTMADSTGNNVQPPPPNLWR